ncbi:MAG: hypothetical protein Q8J62_02875 [Candidatus Cloacimonadaceae bacterium]|nr:hypothetical protein [Candidatus Cloacimonadaceae bacterium]
MLLSATIGVGTIVIIVLMLSLIRHRKNRLTLLKRLPVDQGTRKKVASELGVEGIVAATVSTFDVLYNTMKMSPYALNGIDHLHHAKGFNNLSDMISFMKESIIQSESGSRTWRSMIHKYKGYTGEEIAIDSLQKAGHEVDVPESGTQKGYDVIVNECPYNIKVTDNPPYIKEHLNDYRVFI